MISSIAEAGWPHLAPMALWNPLIALFWMSSSGRTSQEVVCFCGELQADLDKWLDYYSNQRPHHDYHNQDKRPIETIKEGSKLKKKKAA